MTTSPQSPSSVAREPGRPLPPGVQLPRQRTAPPTFVEPMPRRDGFGTTALVCAPAALALEISPDSRIFGVALGVVAVVFGVLGIRRVLRGEALNKEMTVAATALGALAVIVGLLLYIIGALASSAGTSAASTATPSTAPSASVWTPPEPLPVVPAPLGPAQPINARTWQLIAKDPASHAGERAIVFGHVTQFDAATGTSGFRADVDGVVHKPRYGYVDYPTNTILSGDTTLLANLVQGDLFTAEVTVGGAYTYSTSIGGQMTVPQLTVTKVTVIGSVAH